MPDSERSTNSAPPPRRWPWRRAAVFLGFVLALLVLRLIWGVIADRALNAELADAAAAGDPLTPQALFPPADPATARDNAVPRLIQAQDTVDTTLDSPSMSNLEYNGYLPFPPAWHKLADAALASPKNLEALRLVRQARARQQFHWDVPLTSPIFKSFSAPALGKSRNLANLVGDAALHAHLEGDDIEALDRILDMRHHASAVARYRTLIGHLVAIGIDSMAVSRLEIIAPGLTIPPEPDAPLRRQIRSLIDQLLDKRDETLRLRQSFVAERVFQIDTIRWLTRDVWVLRPMYELDLARILRANRELLTAATQPTLPAAKALVRSIPKSSGRWDLFITGQVPDEPPRFSRQFSVMMLPSLDRIIDTDMRARAERRMAAVSLAAQLYRADHRRWPESLQALTPQYLSHIPIDPLGENGRPLGYLLIRGGAPGGADRPIVYSVGPNARDETGGSPGLPDEPMYGWHSTRRGMKDDQYRDLSRWQPPQPPRSDEIDARDGDALESVPLHP